MKKNLTEIVFILDRSGSMSGLETDTIGGFNGMLKKQRKEEGDANITTVLFDDKVEMLHKRVDLKNIKDMTEKDYYVRGCTALLDAIGETINYMGNVQKYLKEEERAEKVLFIITTDGYENSSKEYNYKKIKSMINNQKEKYNWDFLFLGANIDAVETAEKFGIDKDFAVDYLADEVGTELTYDAMNCAIGNIRANKHIDKSWKCEVEKDYKFRTFSRK